MTLNLDLGSGRTLRPTIATVISARLHRLAANWQARRAVLRLDRLEDGLLDDIGVTRADINWALALPLSVNSLEALYDRARRANRRR